MSIVPTFALERAQEILFVIQGGIAPGQDQAVGAGVSRLADGDLGHRDLRAASGMLRSQLCATSFAPGRIRSTCPACISPASQRIDGDQPDRRRRDHHRRVGHVHRRAGAAPPAAQPLAAPGGHRVRRLRRGRARRRGGSSMARDRSILFGEDDPGARAKCTPSTAFPRMPISAELLAWRNAIGGVARTFLVHGEPGGDADAGRQAAAGDGGDAPAAPVFEL